MTGEVFVDSTAWIALLHRADSLHSRATKKYRGLVAEGRLLVTTSLILIEVANALAARQRRRLALELLARCRQTQIGELVWVNEATFAQGWQLYADRTDKDWSLTDCVSFVVMHNRRISEALTADCHFEQAGFVKLI